ncbi:MAG: hypothetical protein WCD53_11755 [Microcoleus sp.]
MAETAHQIQGFWPMTKHYRQRLVAVIALSFLSFTSPLLLIRNASAENLSASKASSQEITSLIKKLKSNDTIGVAHDQIRFALEPLAEYLAGLYLLDINGKDESKWQDFLKVADSPNSPEVIKGFLLAVKDCYLDQIPGAKDTDFLPQQITSRYNNTSTVAPVSP